MDKEEQIEYLVLALESIRDDFAPWHGEDAIQMMDFAHDTLVDFDKHKKGDIKCQHIQK